jgi:hypothetical protein
MKRGYWDAILFVLAIPILAVRGVIRFARHLAFLRTALQATLPCKTCGATIDLLGMWRCGCGATMEGHLLRPCPVCHAFPEMIRCHRCGATQAVRR